MATEELKTVTLGGEPDPEDLYQVWVGNAEGMRRLVKEADGVVTFVHAANSPPGQWSMSIPQSTTNTQIVQLLAALHDHCARINSVEPRTWQTPLERAAAPAPASNAGTTRHTVSIPLNDPNAAQQVEKALGGILQPGTSGQDVIDVAKAQSPTEIGSVPE